MNVPNLLHWRPTQYVAASCDVEPLRPRDSIEGGLLADLLLRPAELLRIGLHRAPQGRVPCLGGRASPS